MASKILLLIGAGPRVGEGVAQAFLQKGYKVALASRTQRNPDTSDQIHFTADVSKADSVADLFSRVKAKWGTPSVVVYNAAALTFAKADDPLSIPLDSFIRDLTINTTSVYAAAHEAVVGFGELPEEASKTFIFTGNYLNEKVLPPFIDLGIGKSATAHAIQTAALAYKDKGFKFYYADERKADGSSAGQELHGDAHGKLYVELSEGTTQGPWQQTFVPGKGYQKF
ncbi:putative short-chain dehydrogenase [Periconia macrospinosa]|uniref:Putative short-chain dehydrogenase n=1 Tax=Periconia macrospinosa TaxID=97972 RepID=A0A2V1EDU5_9PLEO|nr:putative short-chain dehydrogenase [Periconia macrospinosa]